MTDSLKRFFDWAINEKPTFEQYEEKQRERLSDHDSYLIDDAAAYIWARMHGREIDEGCEDGFGREVYEHHPATLRDLSLALCQALEAMRAAVPAVEPMTVHELPAPVSHGGMTTLMDRQYLGTLERMREAVPAGEPVRDGACTVEALRTALKKWKAEGLPREQRDRLFIAGTPMHQSGLPPPDSWPPQPVAIHIDHDANKRDRDERRDRMAEAYETKPMDKVACSMTPKAIAARVLRHGGYDPITRVLHVHPKTLRTREDADRWRGLSPSVIVRYGRGEDFVDEATLVYAINGVAKLMGATIVWVPMRPEPDWKTET